MLISGVGFMHKTAAENKRKKTKQKNNIPRTFSEPKKEKFVARRKNHHTYPARLEKHLCV